MTIRKRTGKLLITGALAALMAGVGAAPALGTDVVFNVTPGGAFGQPSVSTAVTITDTATSTTINCTTSLLKAAANGGTGLPGMHLAKLVTVAFGGCTSGTITFTVTGTAPAHVWWFNATSFSNPTTTGTITAMHLRLAGGNGCTFRADHLTATSYHGKAIGKYTNGSPPTLQILPGPGLSAFPNGGCGSSTATPVNAADPITIAVTYNITQNPQTIT